MLMSFPVFVPDCISFPAIVTRNSSVGGFCQFRFFTLVESQQSCPMVKYDLMPYTLAGGVGRWTLDSCRGITFLGEFNNGPAADCRSRSR